MFDKLLSAGTRMLTGESLFLTHFTNRGNRKAKVAFSAPYPRTVIPMKLSKFPNRELIVQKDGFCAPHMERYYPLRSIKKLEPGSLEVKDSLLVGFLEG